MGSIIDWSLWRVNNLPLLLALLAFAISDIFVSQDFLLVLGLMHDSPVPSEFEYPLLQFWLLFYWAFIAPVVAILPVRMWPLIRLAIAATPLIGRALMPLLLT